MEEDHPRRSGRDGRELKKGKTKRQNRGEGQYLRELDGYHELLPWR